MVYRLDVNRIMYYYVANTRMQQYNLVVRLQIDRSSNLNQVLFASLYASYIVAISRETDTQFPFTTISSSFVKSTRAPLRKAHANSMLLRLVILSSKVNVFVLGKRYIQWSRNTF